MPRRRALQLDGDRSVHTAFTSIADGDLCVDLPVTELEPRRARVAPLPWTWLRQVHGAEVVVVNTPGEGAGAAADASVTATPGAVLAVHTADCAPVLLWGTGGGSVAVGACHAGWRGLEAGVLEATVEAMARFGVSDIAWTLGPCISGPEYEFGDADLERLVGRYGAGLRTTTPAGTPALDLRAAVRSAMRAAGATEVPDGPDTCTAGSVEHWSWRKRGDRARQAAVIWIEAGASEVPDRRSTPS